MVTFIEIIAGHNEGSRYKIENGFTVGRTSADIIVKDPKISSTHARVQIDGKGQLILVDLESSNGIHINGRRVKKIALLSGVSFELGRTQFRVVQVEEDLAEDFSRVVTWRSTLASTIDSCDFQNRISQGFPQRFSPALRLAFIQGIQTDQEVILGYGPRHAGTQSLDIELLDEEAPVDAFEIHPGPGLAQIKIKAPGRVRLNQKGETSDMLQDGDLILFGNSVIKVSYL